MMTAKEYLDQLHLLDVKINQDLERLEEMKHGALGIRAMQYDTDKVQVSPADRLCADVARYTDFSEKINKEINRFIEAKNRVIEQIQGLQNPVYVQVLFKVYVQYKTLKEATPEIGLSYSTVLIKHAEALNAFYNMYTPLGLLP